MRADSFIMMLVILGLGGAVIYFMMKPAAVPPPAVQTKMCGVSYLGTGASIPCDLAAAGIKELASGIKDGLKYVTTELKDVPGAATLANQTREATRGMGLLDVAMAPVGATRFAINEVKNVTSHLNPFNW